MINFDEVDFNSKCHSEEGSVIATLVSGGREQPPLRDKNHH